MKTHEKKHGEMVPQFEDAINNLDQKITDYLVKLSSHSLSGEDSKLHSTLLNTIRDLERIGDHMENIMELVESQIANKVIFSESAIADLDEMFDLTLSTLKQSIKALETGKSR